MCEAYQYLEKLTIPKHQSSSSVCGSSVGSPGIGSDIFKFLRFVELDGRLFFFSLNK